METQNQTYAKEMSFKHVFVHLLRKSQIRISFLHHARVKKEIGKNNSEFLSTKKTTYLFDNFNFFWNFIE